MGIGSPLNGERIIVQYIITQHVHCVQFCVAVNSGYRHNTFKEKILNAAIHAKNSHAS